MPLFALTELDAPIDPQADHANHADRILAIDRAVTALGRVRALSGDLDNITGYALRKEPDRRYASVRDLADDVQRHRSGRPVRARG